MMLYLELGVVIVLILINGLLAMSELAIVSARPARLKSMAERGAGGARSALALATNPGRFLSTVQIGITLVGVLSGAFSGATLGLRLTEYLMTLGLSETAAETLGVGAVVAAITYLSLIVGELVPKQVALRNPERIAALMAPAMNLLGRVTSPFVSVLDISGRLVLRLLGQREGPGTPITEEEIKTIIAEAETAGVLESDERRMIAGVLRLGNRPVRGVMTARTDVEWIAVDASEAELREMLARVQHSRLPVGQDIDALTGVVQARELLATVMGGRRLNVRDHIRNAPIVQDHADALEILSLLKAADVPMALVHDEYGHFQGLVTPADIMEAIAGVFRADTETSEPAAFRREDGSWLLAGYLPADEMAEHLGIPLPDRTEFQTSAGFVVAAFRRLPATGEWVDSHGWRFEVVDMDGRRIDKILARRLPPRRRERGV